MIATLPFPAQRRDSTGQLVGVDRERGVLRGLIICEAAPFKSGKGRFDAGSLREVVRLLRGNREGMPSHFRHPLPPASDSLGYFLGRVKNPRIDRDRVRADLFFDPTAFETPPSGGRPLAEYLLHLATSDEKAAAASLCLQSDKIIERDARGRVMLDAGGRPLPPVWTPTVIVGVDIVSVGDACNSLLGIPRPLSDDDLLRIRSRFRRLRASARPDADLLRARWRNMQRRAARA